MARVHLFELADQAWWPRTFADAGTAYLVELQHRAGLDAALAPLVRPGKVTWLQGVPAPERRPPDP